MSKEITTQQTGLSGSTLYATLDRRAQRWNGSAFEAVQAANWTNYAQAMAEAAGTGYFTADMPAGINSPGPLDVTIYKRLGASAAATDPVVAAGSDFWTGTDWGTVLAPIGLDFVSAADPAGVPVTFREKMIWVFRRLARATQNATQFVVKKSDGTTLTTQSLTDDGITKTLGEPQ